MRCHAHGREQKNEGRNPHLDEGGSGSENLDLEGLHQVGRDGGAAAAWTQDGAA